MSAKTLRRDRCEHETMELRVGPYITRIYCQKCPAQFPIPPERRMPVR